MFVDPSEIELLRQMREELAAANRDFENAGSLIAEIKLDPNLILQIREAQNAIQSALPEGNFLAVADNIALIKDLLVQSGQTIEQTILDALTQAEDKARGAANTLGDAATNAQGVADASAGIAGALAPGVEAAAALARNFGIALSYAQEIEKRAYEAKVGRGRGGDPRKFGGSAADIQKDSPAAQLAYQPGGTAGVPLPKVKTAGSGRRGSRGASGATKRDPQSIIENAQAQVQALQRQIEMIGKTDAEVASLTLRYRALDEAKKMGVDVDREMADSGRTLRQEIDAQAKAVEDLSRQYEAGQVAQSFFEDSVDGIADALAGALTGAKSFRESMAQVFQGIAQDILRAGIRQAITSVFSASSGGGGGGFLSSIVGAFLPGRAKSFDGGGYTGSGPRSGGVDGKGGFPAILHPREVVHDLTKGQGGVGGQSVVRVELSDGLVAAILQEARGQSLQISHAQTQEYSLSGAPRVNARVARDPRQRF